MGAAMIKVSVGRAGHGAANVAYITRLSALTPEEHRQEKEATEHGLTGYTSYISREGTLEPSAAQSIEEVVNEKELAENAADNAERRIDAEPIWTWNAPEYVTGDTFGSEECLERMRKQDLSRPLLARPHLERLVDHGQKQAGVKGSKTVQTIEHGGARSRSRSEESQLVSVSHSRPLSYL